jgi:hypothetical protein
VGEKRTYSVTGSPSNVPPVCDKFKPLEKETSFVLTSKSEEAVTATTSVKFKPVTVKD